MLSMSCYVLLDSRLHRCPNQSPSSVILLFPQVVAAVASRVLKICWPLPHRWKQMTCISLFRSSTPYPCSCAGHRQCLLIQVACMPLDCSILLVSCFSYAKMSGVTTPLTNLSDMVCYMGLFPTPPIFYW